MGTLKPKLHKKELLSIYVKHFIDDSELGITMNDQPFYADVCMLTAPKYC